MSTDQYVWGWKRTIHSRLSAWEIKAGEAEKTQKWQMKNNNCVWSSFSYRSRYQIAEDLHWCYQRKPGLCWDKIAHQSTLSSTFVIHVPDLASHLILKYLLLQKNKKIDWPGWSMYNMSLWIVLENYSMSKHFMIELLMLKVNLENWTAIVSRTFELTIDSCHISWAVSTEETVFCVKSTKIHETSHQEV